MLARFSESIPDIESKFLSGYEGSEVGAVAAARWTEIVTQFPWLEDPEERVNHMAEIEKEDEEGRKMWEADGGMGNWCGTEFGEEDFRGLG